MLIFLPNMKGYTLEDKALSIQQNCGSKIPKMVGEAKSATQSVIIILTLNGLFQKKFQVFYFTLGNSRQNKGLPLQTPHNCVTLFKNFKA